MSKPALIKTTQRAKRIQLVTSLSTLIERTITSIWFCSNLSFVSILQRIENAVMAMATPTKSMYVPKLIDTNPEFVLNSWYNSYAIAQPKQKGKAMPAAPTLKAILQLDTMIRKSTSRPTRNKKSINSTLTTRDKVGIDAWGKMPLVKPNMRPNTEGPRRISPMISAMRRGWRILERG